MENFTHKIQILTDAGHLIVTCPEIANRHENDEHDWYLCFEDEPDLNEGRIAMVNLGADGYYNVKLTSEPLTPLEKKYALEKKRSGVVCESGKLFVGGLEVIPGDGSKIDEKFRYIQGHWVDMENGEYDLTIYTIETSTMSEEPDYLEENYAEIVIHFQPRTKAFKTLKEVPLIFDNDDKYLYQSKSPRKLPPLGIKLVLSAKEVERYKEMIFYFFDLKEDENYKIPKSYSKYMFDIKDKSQIAHGDELLVVSTAIDGNWMYVEVLEKILAKPEGFWGKLKNKLFK